MIENVILVIFLLYFLHCKYRMKIVYINHFSFMYFINTFMKFIKQCMFILINTLHMLQTFSIRHKYIYIYIIYSMYIMKFTIHIQYSVFGAPNIRLIIDVHARQILCPILYPPTQ